MGIDNDKFELVSDQTDNNLETCYCIGPQEGKWLCPCDLRAVQEDYDISLREYHKSLEESPDEN